MKIHKVFGYSVLFSKARTKGHWPLDDLWPRISWGHMCDSTQGSLCPSPMGQCLWKERSILQNMRSHILRTYILRTEWVITSLVSFYEHSLGETKTKQIDEVFAVSFQRNFWFYSEGGGNRTNIFLLLYMNRIGTTKDVSALIWNWNIIVDKNKNKLHW